MIDYQTQEEALHIFNWGMSDQGRYNEAKYLQSEANRNLGPTWLADCAVRWARYTYHAMTRANENLPDEGYSAQSLCAAAMLVLNKDWNDD